MNDLISRQAVIDALEQSINILDAVDRVMDMPSVSHTGHWIEEDMFDGDIAYRCSKCNELFCIIEGTPKDNEYNFCPNCGADMREMSEDETDN